MRPVSIFWFRRDLRLNDNAALYHALKNSKSVLPVFIFDTEILNDLEDKNDKRISFIYDTLKKVKNELENLGSSLYVIHSSPIDAFKKLCEEFPEIEAVYTNYDYEPYALERDEEIKTFLKENNISFHSFKDQVIFEKDEIAKPDNSPYIVYTPYSKKWKEKLNDFYVKPYPTKKYFSSFYQTRPFSFPTTEEIGFIKTNYEVAPKTPDLAVLKNYHKTRDIPAINGTSKLSVHLRFGTISIRELVKIALEQNEKYLNELIWREFYMQILWHFPQVINQSFRKEYDQIEWRNNEEDFKKWCEGKTGYPIVDAGMRELNQTGWMHNRVRMIVASFLTKHLLIDWRWGESYFAKKLLDYELSSNNGSWQWCAGTGCDASPYFRVFNPYIQTDKFDKDRAYIQKWVPEYQDPFAYPKPIVEHSFARKRAIETYQKTLK